MLLNRKEASDFKEGISDPAVQLIVDLAMYQAFNSFLPLDGMDETALLARMPEQPFDMLYFVKMVSRLFGDKQLIADILSGKVTAESLRKDYE